MSVWMWAFCFARLFFIPGILCALRLRSCYVCYWFIMSRRDFQFAYESVYVCLCASSTVLNIIMCDWSPACAWQCKRANRKSKDNECLTHTRARDCAYLSRADSVSDGSRGWPIKMGFAEKLKSTGGNIAITTHALGRTKWRKCRILLWKSTVSASITDKWKAIHHLIETHCTCWYAGNCAHMRWDSANWLMATPFRSFHCKPPQTHSSSNSDHV